MSKPRFLANEDLRGNIVQAVRRMESDAAIITNVQEGLPSVSDEEILEYAWQHQWLLISHDVNTMKSTAEQRIAKRLKN